MVLCASTEGVIILFRLAIQDMKEGKMIHVKNQGSCFRSALQLFPNSVLLFPFHFCDISKPTILDSKLSTDGNRESENNCSLATHKVVSQCRSRVTHQQQSWAGVCESWCCTLWRQHSSQACCGLGTVSNFAWRDRLWQFTCCMVRWLGFKGQTQESALNVVECVRRVASSHSGCIFLKQLSAWSCFLMNGVLCHVSAWKTFLASVARWNERPDLTKLLLGPMLVEVLQWLWVKWEKEGKEN